MTASSLVTMLFAVVLICFSSAQPSVSSSSSSRDDSMLDPFEDVTFANGAHSTIFNHCVEDSRKRSVRIHSIEVSNGMEYRRYVPLSEYSMTWTPPPQPVENIGDCASQCSTMSGCGMFKYDATNGCRVTLNYAYDISDSSRCGTQDMEAVYVLTSASDVFPCLLPSINSGSGCVGVTLETVKTYDDCDDACMREFGSSSLCYTPENGALPLATIGQNLQSLGYNQDLMVAGFWDYYQGWIWARYGWIVDLVVDSQTTDDLPEGGYGSADFYKLYMKLADDGKLHAEVYQTTFDGALCNTYP